MELLKRYMLYILKLRIIMLSKMGEALLKRNIKSCLKAKLSDTQFYSKTLISNIFSGWVCVCVCVQINIPHFPSFSIALLHGFPI